MAAKSLVTLLNCWKRCRSQLHQITLPFHRDRMCNFFQKGVQFLKIQQIVWFGVHLVIHLWTPLNRNQKRARRIPLKLVFSFLLSKTPVIYFSVCILKSDGTQWVILRVVQAEFEDSCSTKKGPSLETVGPGEEERLWKPPAGRLC